MPPWGSRSSSQHRNSTTAAPSRRCAARIPAISPAFLQALGRRQGSSPQATAIPASSNSIDTASGAVPLSTRTGPCNVRSAGTKAATGRKVTSGPRWARVASSNFSAAAKSVTRPSSCRIAWPCRIGLRGTSAPRMFKSQHRESGRVSTAARSPAFTSPSASRARLAAAGSPASASGWAKARPMGASG